MCFSLSDDAHYFLSLDAAGCYIFSSSGGNFIRVVFISLAFPRRRSAIPLLKHAFVDTLWASRAVAIILIFAFILGEAEAQDFFLAEPRNWPCVCKVIGGHLPCSVPLGIHNFELEFC